MAYHVHLGESDIAYIAGLPLSPEAMAAIEDFVFNGLTVFPDNLLLEPAIHRIPGRPVATIDFHFVDLQGDGRPHRLDFHVDHSGMVNGVLIIRYVEHFGSRTP